MEESLRAVSNNMPEAGMLCAISGSFGFKAADADMLSPLALAYIGDCVYELVVRTILVNRGAAHVDRLNSAASRVCRASAQAALAENIKDELTPAELAAMRRGRNAKSATKAKNATMADYRHATGLEALCGWLYLKGETERLLKLLNFGMKRLNYLGLGEENTDGLS